MGDLAAARDLVERADDLVVRHRGIRPVMLPQLDLLDAETPEARVDGPAQVGGGAVGPPSTARGANVTPLGGQQRPVPHAQLIEEGGDQSLVLALGVGAALVAGAVGVRGVEEGDARVQRLADRVEQLLARLGAGLVEGHRAETDRADLVLAEGTCLHAPDPTGPAPALTARYLSVMSQNMGDGSASAAW